jgi:ABC-type nickel/cobalt efflux system permease component RcnA
VGGVIVLIIIAGGAAAGATQSDETGPILAFVGALLVVVITALTTSRRLDRQLSAQSMSSRELLQAEGQRLQQRLDHERKLADVEHRRHLFDEAVAAFERFHTALNSHAVSLQHENTESRRNATMKGISDVDSRVGCRAEAP